ncbi:hypothetical protein [Saccharothrix sp.]|uniref:hypothetical protein n=1 Tax=Saccharothrix sp. TaxID=1873460 RepID=UPI002810F79D|nr:hypothetical protein [Saccharothrix sp.]
MLGEIRDQVNLMVSDIDQQLGTIVWLTDSAQLYEIRLPPMLAGSSQPEAERLAALISAYYNALGSALLEGGRLVESGKRLLAGL